jgi:hypothetical protein
MSHSFHFGHETTSYISVEVLSRARPDATDYWDGNWLNSVVEVAAGPWRGSYRASLRADEFAELHNQLQVLYEDTGSQPAQFNSMEPWLQFSVERSDRLGHLRVAGRAQAEPFFDSHNVLHFALELDQTYLPRVLDELEQVLNEFPVIGSPTDQTT